MEGIFLFCRRFNKNMRCIFYYEVGYRTSACCRLPAAKVVAIGDKQWNELANIYSLNINMWLIWIDICMSM